MKKITIADVNEMYKWAKGDLYNAYANPSVAKREIWEHIRREVIDNGGSDLVVRSRNCMIFTAMYKIDNKLVVIYPTRREVYEIV